jgi:aspartyl-tRNA(Asn)/glutamyl-tRNA(Gln) amidotransferase subunit A
LGLLDAALAIHAAELSPVELVESCLERIAAIEPAVHAFARVTAREARQAATAAARIRPTGPLHGVPIGVKDLLDTAGVATEGGSAVFAGRVPERDATVVRRVRQAGGILVGKTHTHEIAYGVSTPQSRNPWHLERMTSGSSGGSAAALAAREVPMALGTDTGGSLRLPAAFCGVSAIRPTFGALPGDGVMSLAWSFDTAGPMARSARDCLLLLRVLDGTAPADPGAVRDRLTGPGLLAGLSVGIPDPDYLAPATPEVLEAVLGVADLLQRHGARPVRVTPPTLALTSRLGAVAAFCESAAIYRDQVRDRESFSPDVQAYLEAGLIVPGADYLDAQRARQLVNRAYAELLREVDVLLSPVTPVPELPHGATELDGVPLLPAMTPFTLPSSVTGLPSLAFPCGFSAAGMPIGAQLMGPAFSETRLAAVVDAYQQLTDWHVRQPLLDRTGAAPVELPLDPPAAGEAGLEPAGSAAACSPETRA